MRQIKFRFWVDGVNGKFMIYPDNREGASFNSKDWEFYLDDEGFEIINHRGVVEPAHHVPMQYTGLKDENGKEIYEGDIVRVTDDDGSTDFSDGGIGTVGGMDELFMWYIDGDVHNGLYDIEMTAYIEVIGNIYENPELIS